MLRFDKVKAQFESYESVKRDGISLHKVNEFEERPHYKVWEKMGKYVIIQDCTQIAHRFFNDLNEIVEEFDDIEEYERNNKHIYNTSND